MLDLSLAPALNLLLPLGKEASPGDLAIDGLRRSCFTQATRSPNWMMKNLVRLTVCWTMANSLLMAADPPRLDLGRQTNGVVLRWDAATGSQFEVQSASAVTGPWRARQTLSGVNGSAEWIDTEAGQGSRQFYRLGVSSEATAATPETALLGGDFLANGTGLWGEQSGEIAAQGVFLASQLGAGGLQLVTVGTLRQDASGGWQYSPTPTDALTVQFAAGTNLNFYVTRMQGDFSVDATTFLRRSHTFDYRVVSPGGTDLTFTSDVGTGTPSFRATARGTLGWKGVAYAIDLRLTGEYQFNVDSTGSAMLDDYQVTGSVKAPDYTVQVNQRRRFEMVVAAVNFGGATRYDSATADQDWINNTLQVGADTFQWVNVTKQKSFKNGKPSSLDTFWKTGGVVLRNGQPFGTYELRPDLHFLRFFLVLPNAAIELEAWPTGS